MQFPACARYRRNLREATSLWFPLLAADTTPERQGFSRLASAFPPLLADGGPFEPHDRSKPTR
jgi:hypothetical protein